MPGQLAVGKDLNDAAEHHDAAILHKPRDNVATAPAATMTLKLLGVNGIIPTPTQVQTYKASLKNQITENVLMFLNMA